MGASMSDIQNVLEKLRGEVAECRVLSNVATDPEKRELFARVAEHINGLASAVQNELVVEPTIVVDAIDQRPANAIFVADKEVEAAGSTIVPKPASIFLQMGPWLVVVALAAVVGTLVLARAVKDPPFTALETKVGPSPTSQEETRQALADLKQAIAEFRSAEDDKRRLLSQQFDALVLRLDNLEKARAEIAEPTTRLDAETLSEPATKRERETLRHLRHRKISSFNSRRPSYWGSFGGAPQWRF
jgi:hypothetical protein